MAQDNDKSRQGRRRRSDNAIRDSTNADQNVRILHGRRHCKDKRICSRGSLRALVSGSVFIVLLGCLVWQVRVNVQAFLDKLTTMTVLDIDREELHFPKITFCPGFKPGAFDDEIHQLPDKQTLLMSDKLKASEELKLSFYARGRGQVNCFDYYGVDNATEDLIDAWWESITYDLDEFLSGIVLGNQHYNQGKDLLLELRPSQLLHEASPVGVREISSPYGRCYEVTSTLPFKTAEFISLYFNLTGFGHKKIPIYIYEHGDIGLLSNYWVTEVFSVSIGRGETLDLPIVKQEVSYISNDKIPCAHKYEHISDPDEDQSQFHCVKHWAQQQYRKINCTNVCSVPQSSLYTDEMDPPVPPCLTREEGRCAIRELTRIYSSQDRPRVTGCLPACVQHSFRVSLRHEVSSWDGVSSGHESLSVATVFYPTSRIVRNQETRLIDNSAIISAIGGSLGLFLGFSCWECFKSSMKYLEDFIWPRYGHSTSSSNNSRLMRQQKKVMMRKSNKDDPSQPPKFKQLQSFVDVQIT